MESLIFDRMSSDVDNALNNPNSTSDLKGAYNCSDLNRVESWCEYLQYILAQYGFKNSLDVKKDWELRDYPTRTQIDRIRENIDTLKEFCYSLITEDIVYDNTLDYQRANTIEKVLYDINTHISNFNRIVDLQYKIGTTLIQQKRICLIVNTD